MASVQLTREMFALKITRILANEKSGVVIDIDKLSDALKEQGFTFSFNEMYDAIASLLEAHILSLVLDDKKHLSVIIPTNF